MDGSRNPDTNERGFVLVTALWLLILVGAVAALLLARSVAAATDAVADAEALRARLAIDAAIETVAADLLINGQRSPFGYAPSTHNVTIGGWPTRVRIEDEGGKLDLNEGRLELVERLLRGLGWEADARGQFLQELRRRRVGGDPFRSMPEFRLAAARARPDERRRCLEALVTIYSGLTDPEPAQIGAELAHLIGSPIAGSPAPRSLRSGAAIRIEAQGATGRSAWAVVRIGGRLDQPLLVSSWSDASSCA